MSEGTTAAPGGAVWGSDDFKKGLGCKLCCCEDQVLGESASSHYLGAYTRYESINSFSAVLSTKGRVVGLCWAQLKPKGPKGPST